jgi:hypothetical protein
MKKVSKISILFIVAVTLMCCIGVILIAISQRTQPAKAEQVKVEPGVSTLPGECTIVNQPGIKPCSRNSLVRAKTEALKTK